MHESEMLEKIGDAIERHVEHEEVWGEENASAGRFDLFIETKEGETFKLSLTKKSY